MSARTLLHTIYALLIEGADSEGIEKLDRELERSRPEVDQNERIAKIIALGGVVAR